MIKAKFSVRARILAIALVPSVALLVIGVGAAGYLVAQGVHAQDWSTELEKGTTPGIQFSATVQEERRLTLLKLAGDQQVSAALDTQRGQVDDALTALSSAGDALIALNPGAMKDASAAFYALRQQLAAMRQQIDAGKISVQDTYTFYNQLLSVVSTGLQGVAATAPDSGTAAQEATATGLFQVAEAMSRGNALVAAAVTANQLTAAQLQEYVHQVGGYHSQLENLLPTLTADERTQYQTLTSSPAWAQLTSMENAIIQRGVWPPQNSRSTAAGTLPMSVDDWQNAATQVSTGLLNIWRAHHSYAQQFAAQAGRTTETQSLIGGAAVLAATIIAFLIALRLSNRLIGRLRRLRGDTLALADERLPEIMGRLRDGEAIDLDAEMSPLDHGKDEIGQVADAFNSAQFAAVSAAVTEAKTREGVSAVFLNIAHRSQLVVHRQLEILDKAEFGQEDPAQLEMLFQLDHLATRERRNAENLVILGGEQPGRQWRNPVSLVELVRSAVAETEHYARVRTARMPDVSVLGNVVADLIHLLAELVDNATSFSPPESRVEVSGNVVGKGVVVEITDQGLGMPEEEIARVNEMLRNPPDFTVATLSSDSRLGMFVVAQLAARNGVAVRLVESDYGGIRAIVLIPTALIVDTPATATTNGSRDPEPRERGRQAKETHADEAIPAQHARIDLVSWPTDEPSNRQPIAPPAPVVRTGQHRERPEPVERARPAPAPSDDRPVLPRRRRQASLAPQLARDTPAPVGTARSSSRSGPERARSAEQARNLLSAIETGTRQGRRTRPETEPTNEDSR